ncbi:MAG: hypothetical protein H6937_10990 [Burkholderiales bacterium]|nr:hypothetical protein [Burkholderiales bacterium]
MNLPSTAIGKDYLGYHPIAKPPSGSGFQFSVFGMFGFVINRIEGSEFNQLGLIFEHSPESLVFQTADNRRYTTYYLTAY